MSQPSALPPLISFDLSHCTQIDVHGADRATFLNGFCTNDVRKLAPGGQCEAFIPDIKGKILGHVLIANLPDRLRLVSVPEAAAVILPHLRKYVLDADVEFKDVSAELGLICLSGDEAAALLGLESNLKSTECRPLDGSRVLGVALGNPVLDSGLLLSGPRQSLADWRESIPESELALGRSGLLEILRIENGFPWWNVDITPENLAQEAGRTQQAISFTKGCYLGQEPIARLDALGHTNKELRGLVIEGEGITVGSEVLVSDAVVGKVTSAAYSPIRQRTVALAMLRAKHAAPGTELHVKTANGPVAARVFWPRVE